jgi:hypothetical protein
MNTDFLSDIHTENQILMNDMLHNSEDTIIDETIMVIPSDRFEMEISVHFLEMDNGDIELGFYDSHADLMEIGSAREFVDDEHGEGYWENMMKFVHNEFERVAAKPGMKRRLVCATTKKTLGWVEEFA